MVIPGNHVAGDVVLGEGDRDGSGQADPFECGVHVDGQPCRLELDRPAPPPRFPDGEDDAGSLGLAHDGGDAVSDGNRFGSGHDRVGLGPTVDSKRGEDRRQIGLTGHRRDTTAGHGRTIALGVVS